MNLPLSGTPCQLQVHTPQLNDLARFPSREGPREVRGLSPPIRIWRIFDCGGDDVNVVAAADNAIFSHGAVGREIEEAIAVTHK